MNRKFFSLTLAFAIILLSSVVALAESPDEARVSSFFAPDLDSVQAKNLAEEVYPLLSESTRAVHDVNDIYLLLYDDIRPALMGLSSGGNYSLPRIAYYEREIYNAIYGQPSSVTRLDEILDNMLYAMDSRYYTIPQLQAMTWNQLVDLNSTQGTALNRLTSINNLLTVTNSKLDNMNSSLDWVTRSDFTYLGASTALDDNYVGLGYYGNLYFTFGFNPNGVSVAQSSPQLIRLFIPYETRNGDNGTPNLTLNGIYHNSTPVSFDPNSVFLEPTASGTFVYIFDLRIGSIADKYRFNFSLSNGFLDTRVAGSLATINFNEYDYQIVKTAFYTKRNSDSLSGLDKLVELYASDDLIQAKQNQQNVEDGVLTDFTGSGSESMSLSDVGGVKNVSSNAKQFLGTGSSGSNALSVFNVNGQGLWQWFSQTTANNLDSTTPTRGSDGYLTIYDQNMQDYFEGLGGDLNAR